MRAAFFALLLLNLAFMGWAAWVDPPPQATTPDAMARLPRLKLAGEMTAAKPAPTEPTVAPPVAMATPAAPTSDASPPPPPRQAETKCVSVGPFSDVAIATKAADALHSRGFTPVQRMEQGESSAGFWVYIPGVTDAAAADKIFKTLDRNGIQDARLMAETPEGRKISVGLFSERDRAEKRVTALEKMGLKAEVGDRKLPTTQYWVDLSLKPSDGALPVQDLVAAGAGSGRLSIETCPQNPTAQPASTPQSAPGGPGSQGSRVPPTTVAGTTKLP